MYSGAVSSASGGGGAHYYLARRPTDVSVCVGSVAVHLFAAVRPEPGRSPGAGDRAHLQNRPGQVQRGEAFFLCFQAYTTWIMCHAAELGDDPESKFSSPTAVLQDQLSRHFKMPVYGGILNIFEYLLSFGRVHTEREESAMALPSAFQVVEFFKALFLPFLPLYRICSLLSPNGFFINMVLSVVYALCFFGWIALFSSVTANYNLIAFGWSAFFIAGCVLSNIRGSVRARFGIGGNVVEDFAASSFFYPQALVQMLYEFEMAEYSDKKSDDSNDEEADA